jgi:PAB-dependent poly(A)-specific ribonuclease subunit 2
MPYYTRPLLSGWTPQFETPKYDHLPPPKIPPQILNTMKKNDNVLWAALPKEFKGRRNMVAVGPKKDKGRFRSKKARKSEVGYVL